MNYYEVLGVEKTATPDEIKKAYKRMAMKHHPDKGGDTEQFQKIKEAYDVLSDENKRAQYDNPSHRQFGGDFNFDFGGMGQGFSPDDLDAFLRGFMRHQQKPTKNKDVRLRMGISLKDTLSEFTRNIVLPLNGNKENISVNIPRGILNGTVIHYKGLGDNSDTNLPRGDLIIEFVVDPHPIFMVHGYDLIMDYQLSFIDAILGTTIEVSGLDDTKFKVTIPPNTKNGQRFRVAKNGLFVYNPNAKSEERGYLIIVIDLVLPNLNSKQLELLKQIKNA